MVEGYDVNGDVERIVLDIHAKDPVRAIVAQAEFDMERAARLRAYLGLSGQSAKSAEVFRNKVAMKACARKGGIAVADWIELTDTPGLLAFVERVSFPIVIKPQNGAGSFNVRVIRDDRSLKAFIAEGFTPALDIRPNMMADSFVTGRTYHVDGLVLSGETVINWPSIYDTASLEFQDGAGEANASYLLQPDNPLTSRLRAFVQGILDAFPTPDNYTFHAEVFHTDDDQLVLCEIASRTGGARINDALAACFDVNISEHWARAECGLPRTISGQIEAPLRLGGWALVAPRPGVVLSCPEACDLPGLTDFTLNIAVGQKLSTPKAATECIAGFVFHAESEEASRGQLPRAATGFTSRSGSHNDADRKSDDPGPSRVSRFPDSQIPVASGRSD